MHSSKFNFNKYYLIVGSFSKNHRLYLMIQDDNIILLKCAFLQFILIIAVVLIVLLIIIALNE